MATQIVIQKGTGLTQGLLALVKKNHMEMTDGKIDKTEWNATIDKLAEIQQNRVKNKQASIFTGGSEKKDWGKNYVVQPTQTAEFSEAEIKSLYETMGVKAQNQTKKPEADQKLVPPPKAAQDTNETTDVQKQAPAKETEPIKQKGHIKPEGEGFRATNNSEIFYNSTTKMHYKYDKASNKFISFEADYVYKDGAYLKGDAVFTGKIDKQGADEIDRNKTAEYQLKKLEKLFQEFSGNEKLKVRKPKNSKYYDGTERNEVVINKNCKINLEKNSKNKITYLRVTTPSGAEINLPYVKDPSKAYLDTFGIRYDYKNGRRFNYAEMNPSKQNEYFNNLVKYLIPIFKNKGLNPGELPDNK